MVYNFTIDTLPKIENVYSVIRRTVWQVADPNHILLFVLDGECKICTNNHDYHLQAGSCLFIPAEQSYKRTPVGDSLCEMLYVHFSLADELSEYKNAEALQKINKLKAEMENSLLNSQSASMISMTDIFLFPALHDNGDVLEICRKIKELLEKYKLHNHLFVTVYFCELLALLSKQTMKLLLEKETELDVIKVPHNLKKAIWYIKQNYTKKLSVEDLCTYCNVSQSQLTRYFKSAFNTTCAKYIIELRINRAKEMFLNSPELSIKNVCGAVGFEDQHYFSRAFIKLTGETPSAYKYRVNHYTPPKET